MSGPTKIIELDGEDRSKWRIEEGALHLWEGRLWRKEAVGCVLCVEEEGIDHTTFSRAEVSEGADGEEGEETEHFHCLHHGSLKEVPYEMVKKYTVNIGGVIREGEESVKDSMLFPSSMSDEEQAALIGKLLDEAESEEEASGPTPEPDAEDE